MDIKRKVFWISFLVGVLAIGPVVVMQAEEFWFEERTLEVDLGEKLDVLVMADMVEGNIQVVGEDRPSIAVTVERFDRTDENRNRAKVDVDFQEGIVRLKALRGLKDSNITLRVPRAVSLRLRSRDGTIDVSSISGEIEVSVVDGDIQLLGVSGGVVANAVDGNIRVELFDTKLENPISLATVDGDVELVGPRSLGAMISASTIDGEFDSEIALQRKGKKSGFEGFGNWVGISVDGVFGEGGPPISMKTIDGDILIKAKD